MITAGTYDSAYIVALLAWLLVALGLATGVRSSYQYQEILYR